MISCLLLAAGESKRMGVINKLLLPIDGLSFIRRTAEEVMKFPFHEIKVITGHDSEKIQNEIPFAAFSFVHNKKYMTGMHSSIRAGVLSLDQKTNGFMVCLSDQPYFHAGIVEKLIRRFSETSGPRIVFPTFQGKKGHPVIISNHFIPEILREEDGDFGCNYLFKRHPSCLLPVEINDVSPVIDVDTPEQYQEFERA